MAALRLWTGPMSARYNGALREATLRDPGTAALDVKANSYSTTIGLIISGLIKLGRIATAPRDAEGTAVAFRGLGLGLPAAFFTPDEQGFCGVVEPGFLSLSDDEAVAAKYRCTYIHTHAHSLAFSLSLCFFFSLSLFLSLSLSKRYALTHGGTADSKLAIIFELELGKASLGAELSWLSQFPHDSERLLPPWTHLQVVGGPTRRADGVTVVRVRPTVFQNMRTVEEVAGARKGEVSAHIKGLVTDLREKIFYPSGNQADLNYVLDCGLAERLAAFEQDLLARFCKYEPEWYHDNGKYKSVFLDVLREVENARSRIADPASSLSRQLASVSARTASTGGAAAGPKPGELSVGTKVEIHSLLQAPELNGVRGEIVDPPPQDPGTGRWSVKIEKEGRLVALKSSNLRLVSTPSLRGAGKKVMAMQRVVQQMQNAVSEQHSKFFQVCHSTTHARAHTHKLAPKAVD